jgi:hypothetical protein
MHRNCHGTTYFRHPRQSKQFRGTARNPQVPYLVLEVFGDGPGDLQTSRRACFTQTNVFGEIGGRF